MPAHKVKWFDHYNDRRIDLKKFSENIIERNGLIGNGYDNWLCML